MLAVMLLGIILSETPLVPVDNISRITSKSSATNATVAVIPAGKNND